MCKRLQAINSLKNVDSTALLQFLHPVLNMLLRLIGSGGETLQVAAFRAMVNILTRVQHESVDDAERNRFLISYVDFAFDNFGGRQPPVYPGLSTVWGSLARSKLVHFVNRDFSGLANDFLSLGFIPEGVDIKLVSDALHTSFGDGSRQSRDFQIWTHRACLFSSLIRYVAGTLLLAVFLNTFKLRVYIPLLHIRGLRLLVVYVVVCLGFIGR